MRNIVIPKDNASDNSVTVTKTCYSNGDSVKSGDIIFIYETSKASIEVEADIDGFIYFFVNEEDEVDVGNKVAVISSKKINSIESEELKEESIKSKQKNKIISKKAKELIKNNNIDISKFKEEIINTDLIEKYLSIGLNSNDEYQFKNKDIILFGVGGHGGMCYDIIKSNSEFNLVGFIDDDSATSSFDEELLYFGTMSNIEDLKRRGLKNIILGIGLIHQMVKREKIYLKLKKYFTIPTIIHKSAVIEDSAKIAEGCQIMAGAIIGSNSSISENCIINSGAIISHDSLLDSSTHITPGAIIAGHVSIGKRTIIGMGSTIYIGLNIGSDVIINNGLSIYDNIGDKVKIK